MSDYSERKKEIVKLLSNIQPGKNRQEVFFDWVKMMAVSISNAVTPIINKVYVAREEEYKNIIKTYSRKDLERFAEAMACLTEILTKNPCDVLGEIFHELSCNNKKTGQFFTPFHLSVLTAETALSTLWDKDIYTLNEPSVGSGGMVLAFAGALKKRGINYVTKLVVSANDIDWNCVYMCYVQLSLAGIKATVMQGDTLKNECRSANQFFYTPAKMLC